MPKPPRDHLVQPQNPSVGSLRATKCLDASYSVPRRHTISMGPYHGIPGHPGSSKIQFVKFSPFSTQNLPCKTAKTATGPSCATPKPVCRGPCGPPSAWMPPTVSQDATQSVWGPTMGSPRHPGSGKIEKTANFTHFGVLKKTQVKNPKNPQRVNKIEILQK